MIIYFSHFNILFFLFQPNGGRAIPGRQLEDLSRISSQQQQQQQLQQQLHKQLQQQHLYQQANKRLRPQSHA
jgi:hypothetical protein